MSEFDRRRLAEARSQRATPEELREATQRYKELQEELRQLNLNPEARHGEERLDRYEREMRLQTMREEFQIAADVHPPRLKNTWMLALVMTVSSFLMCAFCAGGTYYGLTLLNQKPAAVDTGSSFWSAMSAKDYQSAHDADLAPVLGIQLTFTAFDTQAKQVDAQYGPVTGYALLKQDTPSATNVTLTYTVTRTSGTNHKFTYPVVLTLQFIQNAWKISDIGALFTPAPTPGGTPGAYGTPATK
ncbi:MAG TPA: hypothetical protein VGN32_02140 [Ktedonobacterales bacterium]|jgi:hypothetical protein|nr:hypothetical protein [Ktedonobacterales bacterium]